MRISDKQIKKIIQEEIRKVFEGRRENGKCLTPGEVPISDTECAPPDAALTQDAPDEPQRAVPKQAAQKPQDLSGLELAKARLKQAFPETAAALTGKAPQSTDLPPIIAVTGKCPGTHPHNIGSKADGTTRCSRKDPLAKPPKPKKTYKYSKKVEAMQKVMSGHPEIGSKLKAIMSKNGQIKKWADGKLGPATQKAVNYLRRYYRKKGKKVARGVDNVLDFLASPVHKDPAAPTASEEAAVRANPEAIKLARQLKVDKHVEFLRRQPAKRVTKALQQHVGKGGGKRLLKKLEASAKRKGYKQLALVISTIAASA